jgi:hypothetical protein
VRVADFILPNIHQFPPNQDPVVRRNELNRAQATTWAVPLDDTQTMQTRYYRAPLGKGPRSGTVFWSGRQPGLRGAPASSRRLGRPGEHSWRDGPGWPGARRHHGPWHHHDA